MLRCNLRDGYRAIPNCQFHSLLCFFTLFFTFPHTLSLQHSQTLSLSRSFISIHRDCPVNIKWVPPVLLVSLARLERTHIWSSTEEIDSYLQVYKRFQKVKCVKLTLLRCSIQSSTTACLQRDKCFLAGRTIRSVIWRCHFNFFRPEAQRLD